MKSITYLQFPSIALRRSPSPRGRFAAWASAVALGCMPLAATADCVDTRKATPGEVAFHSRAMAALVAALPPVPSGGMLQNKDHLSALGAQCAGATGDFRLEAKRFYELNYRKSIVSVAINVKQLPATDNELSAAYGSASPNGNAALKVNNVVWSVSGSDSPLRKALADGIDRARLQALVGKALPSEAESAAYAAKAVPANIANVPASASPAPASTSPSAGPAQSGVTAPSNAPAPAAPAAPDAAGEPLKKATEAVNQLRGLFGR